MNNPFKNNTITKADAVDDLATATDQRDDNRSLTELRGAGIGATQNTHREPLEDLLKKLLSSQVMVVAVVLVVSIGSLMFMRSSGMGAKTSIKAVKLDYEPPSAAQSAEQARILAELERSLAPLNISASSVSKNPFTMKESDQPLDAATPQDDGSKAAKAREEEIKNALSQIVLNGVMDGPVPLARINGRTVRVGDTVNEIFIVGEIHDRAIDLIVDNKTFTVSMGDTAGSNSNPRGLRANPQPRPNRR